MLIGMGETKQASQPAMRPTVQITYLCSEQDKPLPQRVRTMALAVCAVYHQYRAIRWATKKANVKTNLVSFDILEQDCFYFTWPGFWRLEKGGQY